MSSHCPAAGGGRDATPGRAAAAAAAATHSHITIDAAITNNSEETARHDSVKEEERLPIERLLTETRRLLLLRETALCAAIVQHMCSFMPLPDLRAAIRVSKQWKAAVGENGGITGLLLAFFFFGCQRAVAAFASVAVGHPDGLDGFAIGHADKVAFCAINRAGGLDYLGQADRVAVGGEGLPEARRECGDLVEAGGPVAIEGLGELAGTVRPLAVSFHKEVQLIDGLSEERLALWQGFGDFFCFVQHRSKARLLAGSL